MTIRSAVIAAPIVVFGWISILGIVGYFSDEAPAYIVPLPSNEFLSNLPDGSAILSMNGWSVTLVSSQSGFARHLYHSGAKLVLPSGLTGCAALARRKRV